MITLNKTTWYIQYFFWCCAAIDKFWDSSLEYRVQKNSNLCQFFRVILHGTIVAILSVTTYVFTVFTIFVLPFILYGLGDIWHVISTILFIIGCVITLVAFVYVCVLAAGEIQKRLEQRPEKQPGLLSLFCQYVSAVHRKVCPLISFKDN